jgi:precorrin-6B methylase 1
MDNDNTQSEVLPDTKALAFFLFTRDVWRENSQKEYVAQEVIPKISSLKNAFLKAGLPVIDVFADSKNEASEFRNFYRFSGHRHPLSEGAPLENVFNSRAGFLKETLSELGVETVFLVGDHASTHMIDVAHDIIEQEGDAYVVEGLVADDFYHGAEEIAQSEQEIGEAGIMLVQLEQVLTVLGSDYSAPELNA